MSLFFSSHCREIFKRKIETEIFRIVSLANNKNWKRKIAASFTRLFLILDEVSVKVFLFGKMGNERARYACEKSRGIEVDRGMSSGVKCFYRSKKCYRGETALARPVAT